VNAAQMYRWKRSLDQGLKESGKLVPKSLVGGLQKRVEELEEPWAEGLWYSLFSVLLSNWAVWGRPLHAL
jgi:hypothetical protein